MPPYVAFLCTRVYIPCYIPYYTTLGTPYFIHHWSLYYTPVVLRGVHGERALGSKRRFRLGMRRI